MINGMYQLHIYCCDPHDLKCNAQETELGWDCETGAQARRKARKRGWKLDLKTSTATCPECAKKGK